MRINLRLFLNLWPVVLGAVLLALVIRLVTGLP